MSESPKDRVRQAAVKLANTAMDLGDLIMGRGEPISTPVPSDMMPERDRKSTRLNSSHRL